MTFCIPAVDMHAVIIFIHDVEMLRPYVAERRHDIAVCVMKPKTTFLDYTLRFEVPFIISAPYRIKTEAIKTSRQQRTHRLGNQPASPERLADPVADLGLATIHFSRMHAGRKHYTAASDGFTYVFQYHGIDFRRGKYSTDYFPAILNRRMRLPSCNRTHIRISGIFEERSRIGFMPMSQYEPFSFNHYISQ